MGAGSTHFIGLGGAGMSALARILLGRGERVSGSDAVDSPTLRRLAAEGARIAVGHRRENLAGATRVVFSSAIPPDNPERLEALRIGLPLLSRGSLLADLLEGRRAIVIAGSHGKTTTTAMVGLALWRAGCDPTILLGGDLPALGGNARLGASPYWVAESDESDGSFLQLHPHVGLVTNVDDDHLDRYGSRERLVEAFDRFLGGIPAGGAAVLCADDPVANALAARFAGGAGGVATITYGLSPDAHVRAGSIASQGLGSRFEVLMGGRSLGEVALRVPGLHNVQNALGAIAAGIFLGLPLAALASGLGEFHGVRRRFEVLGERGGVAVVDDYAHHPTEIAATLVTARSLAPRRLRVLFQPHRYTRTAALHRRFAEALALADEVWVSEIYPAGEPPIPGVGAELIVRAAKEAGADHVGFCGTLAEGERLLAGRWAPGDLILTMGAGDVREAGERLARALPGAPLAEVGPCP